MMKFSHYMPARILFGPGSIKKLARMTLPGKKALLITGGVSTTRLGYVDTVRAVLRDAGADSVVYNRVHPNPTLQNVNECAALCRSEQCDFVVGLGGGSSIDTAKATAVMAVNEGELWDYVYGGSGKAKPVPVTPLPILAVTTTAGTGTEADPWAVITNGSEKIGLGFDGTFPTISVVDPDFMMTVPARMTAYQGFDALFHATEGYIAKSANPISDLYALESIRRIGKSLTRAVLHGDDADARCDVAFANTLSGFVETMSSCTSEHAMEHALSALHPTLPHGAGLIMLSLSYYTAFAEVCGDRFVEMARALGRTDASQPMDFVETLRQMQQDCGVDTLKMSDYGIDNTNFGTYADNALTTMGGLFRADQKPLTREDVIDIYQASYR